MVRKSARLTLAVAAFTEPVESSHLLHVTVVHIHILCPHHLLDTSVCVCLLFSRGCENAVAQHTDDECLAHVSKFSCSYTVALTCWCTVLQASL